jgi:hypothetical protein
MLLYRLFWMTLAAIASIPSRAASDTLVSPFNGRAVSVADGKEYEFIVTGHLHGASGSRSGFPASSLLANIDTLNTLNPSFMVCLGDLFLDVTEENIANYERSFFRRISFPLFNVVGNHDVSDLYDKRFGSRFYSFQIGSEIFIFLDTEANDGSISGEQYEFLEMQLQEAGTNAGIRNILIFSHRPVWAESNPRFNSYFSDNTRSSLGNNFVSEIEPLLVGLARVKNVYWMSGSLGSAPASFFYAREEGASLTYIQTAIRDLPRDAVLRVKVSNGNIALDGFSFNGRELKKVTDYNEAYWKSITPEEEKFNYRLLPLYTKQALTHWYFWAGFAAAVCLALALYLLRWRRLKKKRENAVKM